MFKRLQPTDYTVTPFQAYKRWNLTDDHDAVEVLRALKQVTPSSPSDPKTGDGVFQRTVYNLVFHTFYRSDVPYQQFGIEDINDVDLSFPTQPLSAAYVIKIGSQVFGERLLPGSIRITEKDAAVPITLVDDESGNLVVEGTDTIVGNVFYQVGILVLKGEQDSVIEEPESTVDFPTFAINAFASVFENPRIEFRSQVTQYEHEVRCVINDRDFNGVTNPSVFDYEDETRRFVPYFTSDEFQPFITTVGLYDEFLNLVAVGKLPRPIRKPDGVPLTIVIQFDT